MHTHLCMCLCVYVCEFLIISMYLIDTVHMDMCFHEDMFCSYSCDDMYVDGIFVLCEDCRKYLICNGGSQTLDECPNKPNWGFNVDTRKCQYKSPHCFFCSGGLYNIYQQIWNII